MGERLEIRAEPEQSSWEAAPTANAPKTGHSTDGDPREGTQVHPGGGQRLLEKHFVSQAKSNCIQQMFYEICSSVQAGEVLKSRNNSSP